MSSKSYPSFLSRSKLFMNNTLAVPFFDVHSTTGEHGTRDMLFLFYLIIFILSCLSIYFHFNFLAYFLSLSLMRFSSFHPYVLFHFFSANCNPFPCVNVIAKVLLHFPWVNTSLNIVIHFPWNFMHLIISQVWIKHISWLLNISFNLLFIFFWTWIIY